LFIFLFPGFLHAVDEDSILERKIIFNQNSINVKQVIDRLKKLPDIEINYKAKEFPLELPLELPEDSLSINEIADLIEQQTPLKINFKNNLIIFEDRALHKAYKLNGIVKDAKSNEELIAATVFIPETPIGAVTDEKGEFSLLLEPGRYKLIFKYVGYKEKELNINLFNNNNLTIELEVRQQEIEAVNIISTRREFENIRIGRTIETLESNIIEQLATNDVNDALHGRIIGVWVTKVSGAPGDHNKIRIRGVSSILGSTDPLYVVDGMMIPVVNLKSLGIADLNVHDVDNITILKDASSSALYGYMGGNGVILIETKKGGGETQFNACIKMGLQIMNKRYDLMNSEDFYSNLELSDKLISTPFYTIIPDSKKYELYPFYRDSLGNPLGFNNFQEEIFNIGELGEYQLSGQGNFKTIDYYISGNYYKHKGIVTHSSYDKYTFTGSFSKIFKEKASILLLYKGSYQENKNNLDNYLGNNVILKGINYEPAYYYTPDSFLRKNNRLFYNDEDNASIKTLSTYFLSPDILFNKQKKKKIENSNSVSLQGFYDINKLFSIRSTHSIAFKEVIYSSLLPSHEDQPSEMYLSSNENFIIINQQYDLNFKMEQNNHKINSFIRFRNYKDNIYWKIDSINNVDINNFSIENDIYLRGSQSIYGEKGSVLRTINSFITSLSYNYKSKYFVSLIANTDNLKEGFYVRQNEVFSSIALDWDISKEAFIKFPIWLNSFHINANWGQSGNYPLNSLSNDLFYSGVTYSSNNEYVKAVEISNLSNHYLAHEEVKENNFGTKISLLENRINFSGDYFIKYNTHLLIKREIPYYYGGGFFYQNIGKMENRGMELSLEVIPFNRPDLYLSSKIGYSSNNQKIIKLLDGDPISFNNADILYPDFYAKENETLGDITGFSYQGIWNDSIHTAKQGELPKYVNDLGLAYLKVDTLFPSKLINNDKVSIGNSIPKFTCHWINEIEYKNFSCNMLWYAVIGVDKYNATKASTYITGVNSAVKEIVSDTLSYVITPEFYESSYFVEDASFLRLKTLRFSYRQAKKLVSKISITYTITFENLVTITKYSGYDPEATVYTNNSFTDNAIDRGAYPNPKGYYFSINLEF